MSSKNTSDRFLFIIGILVIGFLVFQLIGYLLPDKEPVYDTFTLLEEVMDQSGGKQNWNDIQKMSYTKSFQLYTEDAAIEIDRNEKHFYDFTNGTERVIEWMDNDTLFSLVRNDSTIYQTKNNQKDTLVSNKVLQSKLDAATFVVGLPYTLDNPSASKFYKGIVSFQGENCHVLQVQFEGSDDIWKHYYTVDDLDWKGYWVKTSDHYSLVINEELINVNGFMLSRKRKSYRTDSLQNITYLRATYDYSQFYINKL